MSVATPRAITRNAFVLGVRLPIAVMCLAMVIAHRACGESQEAAAVRQQAEAEQQAFIALQQQLIDMIGHDPIGAAARDDVKKLREEVARRAAKLEQLRRAAAAAENDAAESERRAVVEKLQAALVERENELRQMHERLAAMEREREAPMDDARVQIFRLKFLPVGQAANTISDVLGNQSLRIAADERANSLVLAGTARAIETAKELIQSLDVAAQDADAAPPTPARLEAPRPLIVRVFWLADGVAEDEGVELGDFLPGAVIDAVERLGLESAQIVSQSVSAVSRDSRGNRRATFSSRSPALIFKQPVELTCSGDVTSVVDDVVAMDAGIAVAGPSVNSKLEGSLSAPLGHFMVLGTANSVISDVAAVDRQALVEQVGREPFGFGSGRGDGGIGGQAEQPPLIYKTSRFAFVVQVVEAKSFAPEE